jgi:hypothetical protein
MAIQIIGNSGTVADTDANRNLLINPGIPAWPAAGGYYTVTGQTSAVVAAALAANTPLMTMRFDPASIRKAYVTRFRVLIGVATVGASAGVAGTLGIQRFTAATPTGGTARTVNRMGEALGTATNMFDVRDSNAALTVTSVTFGNVVASELVPLFITSGAMWMEWIFEPNAPIVLVPGDGLSLRTQVAMAATQTWMFSYTVHWLEQ